MDKGYDGADAEYRSSNTTGPGAAQKMVVQIHVVIDDASF